MDENHPKKLKKQNNLTYVNNFIAKVNKKLVTISKLSQEKACAALSAVLVGNKLLIKQYSSEGISDEIPILRAFIWKLLLNYLPEEPKQWEETLTEKRNEYKNFKTFIEGRLQTEIKEKTYKSKEVLEQIIKDVYRTNSELPFFYELVDKNNKKNEEELLKIYQKRKSCTLKEIDEIYYEDKINENHFEVMKRILFIYTYLRPDISYHQGMNELLAPLYYCLTYDKTYQDETEENIEADSFWCFYNLMNKVSLSFVAGKNQGLDAKSHIFENCLIKVDKEIYDKLVELNIRSEYYCYRWFILLFSQEFEINSVLKLWDLIFSNDDFYYYVVYIGIAVLLMKKNIIMNGEMVDVMQTLQNLGDINVDELINKAKEINGKYKTQLAKIINHKVKNK
jgi:hypothetical protein